MNLLTFDLNLLRVFDALMREQNVSRAAERLALSQPAVSNALNCALLTLMTQERSFVFSFASR